MNQLFQKAPRSKPILYTVVAASLLLAMLCAYALKEQYELSNISPLIKGSFVPVDLTADNPFRNALSKQTVAELLKDRTVIGFGEATHGTKEFRQAFTFWQRSW